MTSADNKDRAIVFVHGILGFSSCRILGWRIDYFRDLPDRLRGAPLPVHFPALPGVGHIEDRAQVLADYLAGIDAGRIDLIAHSMGGLDSRYLIHHLDPQRRVRSLTTVGTPHRGSPLAQWVLDGGGMVKKFLRRITLPGLRDLTPGACGQFNAEVGDRSDVVYRSYAGCRPVEEMPLLFRTWARIMQESDGDNDSQVPVASARWGDFMGTLRADHLELAGWSAGRRSGPAARPFAHIEFYRRLVRQLCMD